MSFEMPPSGVPQPVDQAALNSDQQHWQQLAVELQRREHVPAIAVIVVTPTGGPYCAFVGSSEAAAAEIARTAQKTATGLMHALNLHSAVFTGGVQSDLLARCRSYGLN